MEFELELESLHLLVLAVTAIFIILADHDGLAYVCGRVEVLPLKRVRFLHRAVGFGLAGMILTGMLMLIEKPDMFEEPAFYVKMLMVLALIINGLVIGKLSQVATEQPYRALTPRERRPLLIAGAVSGFCWLGAAFIGLFML